MIDPRKEYEKQRDRLWRLIREYWEENDRRKEQRRKVIRDKPTDRRRRAYGYAEEPIGRTLPSAGIPAHRHAQAG